MKEKKYRICASIIESSIEEAVEKACKTKADLVEVRLDYVKDYTGLDRLSEIDKPVISTCMPEWEGGKFIGDEAGRLRLLKQSVKYSDYVTIELKTRKKIRDELIKKASEDNVKVIIAYHDHVKTPQPWKIKEIIRKEEEAGADIGKIAFHARNYWDVVKTMQPLLERHEGIPLITVSMGELGKISRILSPLWGSYLTYGSCGRGLESAPGQLTVDEIRQIFEILSR